MPYFCTSCPLSISPLSHPPASSRLFTSTPPSSHFIISQVFSFLSAVQLQQTPCPSLHILLLLFTSLYSLASPSAALFTVSSHTSLIFHLPHSVLITLKLSEILTSLSLSLSWTLFLLTCTLVVEVVSAVYLRFFFSRVTVLGIFSR